jgi:hypothetical protein
MHFITTAAVSKINNNYLFVINNQYRLGRIYRSINNDKHKGLCTILLVFWLAFDEQEIYSSGTHENPWKYALDIM